MVTRAQFRSAAKGLAALAGAAWRAVTAHLDFDDGLVLGGLGLIGWGLARWFGSSVAAVAIGAALVTLALVRMLVSAWLHRAALTRRPEGGSR